MCEKLPYENPRIDECLREYVKHIKMVGKFRPVASCCGHGKYQASIIVQDVNSGVMCEWFTLRIIQKRKRNRYYKLDNEGYYYVEQLGPIAPAQFPAWWIPYQGE
jgi:hypothetical protein